MASATGCRLLAAAGEAWRHRGLIALVGRVARLWLNSREDVALASATTTVSGEESVIDCADK